MDVLTKCRAHPPPSRWSWLQRKNRETKMSQWFQLLHIIHHSSRSSLHMSVCDHDSRHSPFHWEEMYVETSTRSNHRVGNCNLSLWRASWVRWWTGAGESCTLPMKLQVDLLLVSPTWRRKENHAKTWNTCFFSTYFPFQCSKSRALHSLTYWAGKLEITQGSFVGPAQVSHQPQTVDLKLEPLIMPVSQNAHMVLNFRCATIT